MKGLVRKVSRKKANKPKASQDNSALKPNAAQNADIINAEPSEESIDRSGKSMIDKQDIPPTSIQSTESDKNTADKIVITAEKTEISNEKGPEPASNSRSRKDRSIKRIDISETGDQMMEIIDDALDESTEDLGLTEEIPASLTGVGVSSILTVIFGLVVLGFAIFGIISAVTDIKTYSDAKKANTEKIAFFENLILPLCASDAPTFDGASALNSDVAIAAACWDIILSPASNYTAENGFYTISYLDIDIRINKLFGKGVSYTHTSVGDQETLFAYDEESGMYTIPAYPRLAYFPTVDKLESTENGYILTVSYHSPVTNWITGKNATDKVMIYTVTGSGIAYNITAVEVGEIFNTQEL